jgi:hypothetical protein
MNISATFIGELIFYFFIVFVLVVGFLSFYLGKRKTNSPKLAALIGVLLSLIPPLCLIYLGALTLKEDIKQPNLA